MKTVNETPIQFGVSTLSRIMQDCVTREIESEQDMQELINKLWPALVCEHEQESDDAIRYQLIKRMLEAEEAGFIEGNVSELLFSVVFDWSIEKVKSY